MSIDRARPVSGPDVEGEIAPSTTGFELADRELHALQALVRERAGIDLGDGKRSLLVARLSRRLRHLGLGSFTEYVALLSRGDPDGDEMQAMLDCITTNTTSFFREEHHFEHLARELFAGLRAPVRIWCCACSTGEEPYSLALTAARVLGSDAPRLVSIVATDIDTTAISVAERAVYPEERLAAVDPSLWKPWMLRGRGDSEGLVRLRDEIRQMVSFRRLSLVDEWPALGTFDAILCRNVVIYFDQETTRLLIDRLSRQLRPAGHLMLGHSETLPWMSRSFEALGRTIYRRRDAAIAEPAALAPLPAAPRRPSGVAACDRTIGAGDVLASTEPLVIRTILGSCVSVCMFDLESGVGGMNHFALPRQTGSGAPLSRYGVHAMELLINAILNRGGDRRRLRAKAFGACNVLSLGSQTESVAARNATFVREFLTTEGIPLVGERLGGNQPLELIFETRSARAFVRPIERRLAVEAIVGESRYRSELEHPDAGATTGGVEIFGPPA